MIRKEANRRFIGDFLVYRVTYGNQNRRHFPANQTRWGGCHRHEGRWPHSHDIDHRTLDVSLGKVNESLQLVDAWTCPRAQLNGEFEAGTTVFVSLRVQLAKPVFRSGSRK
jgi:hypothetical protein